MPTLPRAALAALVAIASTGCVTTGLGRPPADLDLTNDGSPAAKAQLLDTYTLAYRDRTILRPGADPAAVGVDEVSAFAASDEAFSYIGSSEAAGAELETGAVAADRFVTDGSLNMLLYAASATLGASIAVAASAPSVVASFEERGPNPGALMTVAMAAGFGAFTGLIAAGPISVVASWTVSPLVQLAAEGDYRRAVRTYNRELAERIERGAPEAPVTAPEVAPPGAPPPPPPPAASPVEREEEPAPQQPSDEEAPLEGP